MRDEQCVRFLQWALPQLHMRWDGFRKVRRQVCKRIDRRLRHLGLVHIDGYRRFLEAHIDEWQHLDTLCRITISRFYRDRGVFELLAEQVLPELAGKARKRGDKALRVWSAGCAGGEEPYTIAILWWARLQPRFPDMRIEILATDTDPAMLARADLGRYAFASLKELPATLRDQAFEQMGDVYCLKQEYRRVIAFAEQDIRTEQPERPFDLVLCRNLVFTYFDDDLQSRLSNSIVATMHDGAAMVLGIHEHLPADTRELSAWSGKQGIYRKRGPG